MNDVINTSDCDVHKMTVCMAIARAAAVGRYESLAYSGGAPIIGIGEARCVAA
jgi:hypothetical protein